jgi:hypothetical protein
MKVKFVFFALVALAISGCEKDVETPPEKPLPGYMAGYAGKYVSLKEFSNGNDVSTLMDIKLNLSISGNNTSFSLETTEKNPAMGTQTLDSSTGVWFVRSGLDTLVLSRKVGVSEQTGPDGQPYYQDNWDSQYWLIKKIAPGTFSMKRTSKTANQEYHMEKL